MFLKALPGSMVAYIGGAIFDYLKDDPQGEIKELNEKAKYRQKLLDTHTSILNFTENIQETTINEANSVINHTVNILKNESDVYNSKEEAHWISTQLLITMSEFQNFQDTIIKGRHEGKSA